VSAKGDVCVCGERGAAFFQDRAMDDLALEFLQSRSFWCIWTGKVSGCDNKEVKVFKLNLVGLVSCLLAAVLDADREKLVPTKMISKSISIVLTSLSSKIPSISKYHLSPANVPFSRPDVPISVHPSGYTDYYKQPSTVQPVVPAETSEHLHTIKQSPTIDRKMPP
jgi:hypothetical protein